MLNMTLALEPCSYLFVGKIVTIVNAFKCNLSMAANRFNIILFSIFLLPFLFGVYVDDLLVNYFCSLIHSANKYNNNYY